MNGRRSERGGAAVELALLLPVLVMVVFGAIDLSRLFYASIVVASAAHEAAVFYADTAAMAAVDPAAIDSTLQQVAVTESIAGSTPFLIFSGGTLNVTLDKPALAGSTSDTNYVRVQLSYTFTPLLRVPLRGPITLHATAAAPTTKVIS